MQNARVTAFTVSKLLREHQQGGKITLPPSQPRLELTSGSTKTHLIQSQPRLVTKEFLPTEKNTHFRDFHPPKEAKAQFSSTPVSEHMIPTINKFINRNVKRKHYKQSRLAELPNSDKSNFTTKNSYMQVTLL